jgi:hypothetical protein
VAAEFPLLILGRLGGDVDLFMKDLCQLKTCELEALTLENGSASASIELGVMVLAMLSPLPVTGIAWQPGALASFRSLCARGHRPLSLDV